MIFYNFFMNFFILFSNRINHYFYTKKAAKIDSFPLRNY
ncbi:hypothetical protein FORC60_3742 [Bacillus cereus]|nr:hypothetical protein FORC60_3742 [Bacillus cereus]